MLNLLEPTKDEHMSTVATKWISRRGEGSPAYALNLILACHQSIFINMLDEGFICYKIAFIEFIDAFESLLFFLI